VSGASLDAHVQVWVDHLVSYPAWPEIENLPECVACELPDADRPAPKA
jgi:glutathione-regulated potassium-efflux system ancillary protein KefF